MTDANAPLQCAPGCEVGNIVNQVRIEIKTTKEEVDRRLGALEEEDKALHKRVTDHLLSTIDGLNANRVLIVTALLSGAGLIISLIALIVKK